MPHLFRDAAMEFPLYLLLGACAGVLYGQAEEYANRLIDGLARHPLRVAGNQPYKMA